MSPLLARLGSPICGGGGLPCAYVELAEGASVSMADFVCLVRIADRRGGRAPPKYIEVLAELPKTAVGKVFKPALRKSAIKAGCMMRLLAEAGFWRGCGGLWWKIKSWVWWR